MAINDNWPCPWPWTTNIGTVGTCGHGALPGSPCFYCQHPAVGLAPQTFTLGGWQCPGCSRCYSPTTVQCAYCGPPQNATGGNAGAEAVERPAIGACPCQPSAEGGLCGCGEDGDEPAGPCTSAHCSC